MARIFATRVGEPGTAPLGATERAVFRVAEATVPEYIVTTPQAEAYDRQLSQMISQDVLEQYIAYLQVELEAQIDEARLRHGDRRRRVLMELAPAFETVAAAYDAGRPSLVSTRLVADLETPVAAFLKLRRAKSGAAFLLESVEGGAQRGRYSMIGLEPDLVWRCRDGTCEIDRAALSGEGRFAPDDSGRRSRACARSSRRAGSSTRRTCRRWRRGCSAISATTWCAPWSGSARRTPTCSACRTRCWCAPP